MTTFETTSDPLHGTKLFVFLFSRGFCHPGPRMPQNPWKKPKNKKQKNVSPHVTCPASPQTLSTGRNFLFFCFFSVSRGFCHCVSPTISVAHFLCVLFSCFFGSWEKFSHWHSFHPSTCYIDVLIELLIFAIEPSEKIYRKNSSITHLFRHSIGLMFYWYAEVWFLIFKDLARVLQTWNHKTYIFKNGLFKQHFVVQKNVCLKVFAPSKTQYCIPHDKIPLKKNVVFLRKKQILFCRMPHYSSWQLLHATDAAFLEEMLVFL
jgi:hypothetical protein